MTCESHTLGHCAKTIDENLWGELSRVLCVKNFKGEKLTALALQPTTNTTQLCGRQNMFLFFLRGGSPCSLAGRPGPTKTFSLSPSFLFVPLTVGNRPPLLLCLVGPCSARPARTPILAKDPRPFLPAQQGSYWKHLHWR